MTSNLKLEDWIIGNQYLQEKKNYSKAWWDYIDLIRKIENKTATTAYVYSEYEIMTPPPSEFLIFPVIKLSYNNIKFYIKQDFSNGGFMDEWMVSIVSNKDILNIKNHINNVKNKEELSSLGFRDKVYERLIKDFIKSNILFKNYSKNKSEFTFTVKDEYELLTVINIITRDI
jgi:hypothetical protein